jgi:hypothetical protein
MNPPRSSDRAATPDILARPRGDGDSDSDSSDTPLPGVGPPWASSSSERNRVWYCGVWGSSFALLLFCLGGEGKGMRMGDGDDGAAPRGFARGDHSRRTKDGRADRCNGWKKGMRREQGAGSREGRRMDRSEVERFDRERVKMSGC